MDLQPTRAHYDPDLGAFLVPLRHDGREPLTGLGVKVGGIYSESVGACVMQFGQGKWTQVGHVPPGSTVVIMIRTQGVHKLMQVLMRMGVLRRMLRRTLFRIPLDIRADGVETAQLSVVEAKSGRAKLPRRRPRGPTG